MLEFPQTSKKIPFLDTKSILLLNMLYRRDNVLVIESKTVKGCRVMFSHTDLLVLQELDQCVFKSITGKSLIVRSIISQQFDEIFNYVKNNCNKDAQTKSIHELQIFVKYMNDKKIITNTLRSTQSFPNKIILLGCYKQIVDRLRSKLNADEIVQQKVSQ